MGQWFWRLLLAIVTFACLPAGAWAQDGQTRVLVVYAARRDSLVATVGDRQLSRLLDQHLNRHLDYYSEYVDLARFPDLRYQEAFREFLRTKYSGFHFNLVIAVEDAALEFVDRYRSELFPGAPIAFFVVSPDTRRPANSTGVFDNLNFARTLTLATALQPDIKQVFVVTGASPRDRLYEGLARKQFQALEGRLAFTYLSGMPAAAVEERVANLPPHSMYFLTVYSQDGAGTNFRPLEFGDRLFAAAKAPRYAWDDQSMGRGAVGGSLRSLDAAMSVLAGQAARVLDGEPADHVPVSVVDQRTDQVDWRQLQRWGISEARLPEGTLVKFRDPSVWDRYKGYIVAAIGVLSAQSVLVGLLIFQQIRRRRAEAELRRGQADLRTSHERIHDLAGRLLNAQEAERARIARELHDDISQQLALLLIDLQARGDRVPSPPAGDALGEARERAQGIARSVHDLSHRLHPAKLRLMGLVPAISSLARVSARPHVTVTVSSDEAPRTHPQEVTVALYRVAQEAIQNAIKHGSAQEVLVYLRDDTAGVTLTITDDGVGFDVKAEWGKGLGLISMRERLDPIGGVLTVRSAPGDGTRLEITVARRLAMARETVAV